MGRSNRNRPRPAEPDGSWVDEWVNTMERLGREDDAIDRSPASPLRSVPRLGLRPAEVDRLRRGGSVTVQGNRLPAEIRDELGPHARWASVEVDGRTGSVTLVGRRG